MERSAGLEPASLAWKAKAQPIYQDRLILGAAAAPVGNSAACCPIAARPWALAAGNPIIFWGGQRDSNPLQQSGRLRHNPYTMPAWTSVIQLWQGLQESNLRLRIWSPLCCHCTKPLWWAVEDSNLQEPFGHPGYSRGRFRLRANCPWRKVRDSNPRGHKARHRFSRPPHYHSVNLPNGGGRWIRTSERAFDPLAV